jgi:chromate transporter
MVRAPDTAIRPAVPPTPTGHGVSLGEAARVWARIAGLSFGGPAGQIAVMHRILVEERRWIGETRFLHALNYCMLLPGPEAQQLAIYIGWLMHRTLGGIIAGTLFIIPGLLAIMALSWIYVAFGNVPVVAGLFFGLKTAVLAIVLDAVLRIGRRALENRVMVALAAGAFVAIFFLKVPFPAIVLTAGLIGFAGGRLERREFLVAGHVPAPGQPALDDASSLLGEQSPSHAKPDRVWALKVAAICLTLWLGPTAALIALLGRGDVFSEIAVFFSKTAVVTFGGAYAVLSYVAQQAVETHGWLRPGEMLDGLGMAETTPGPLIMVTQFVGFMAAYREPGTLSPMVAGTLGGLLTTWVTFAPCFLWILIGAPFVEVLRRNTAVAGALSAITAAVVGVILNLALWFALHVIFTETVRVSLLGLPIDAPVLRSADLASLALTLAAAVAILRFKARLLPTLLGCALAGIGYHLATS